VDGGEERKGKIPSFDCMLWCLLLVDEKEQKGSVVVLPLQKTSDHQCFHQVVVFKVIFSEGCLSAHFTTWHLSLENTMSPARTHTQGAQARRCC